MSIPINITKDHIEKAILEIQQSVIPAERLSVTYFLNVGNINLPPKYVITIANKYANGIELESKDFNAVEAKNFLKKLKFVIIEKNSKNTNGNIQQLNEVDSNLSENFYYKKFSEILSNSGLQIDDKMILRFTVALLTKPFVILTGLSGSGKTKLAQVFAKWITEPKKGKSINPKFTKNEILKSNKVSYKVTAVDSLSVTFTQVESGIKVTLPYELINEWIDVIDEKKFNINSSPREIRGLVDQRTKYSSQLNSFETHLKAAAFYLINKKENCHLQQSSQICIVPVGADWTNREPLLGYPNALDIGKYVSPDNGVLDLILEANKEENIDKPYFLILDEMNLSHVERYFADFLSAMESSEEIPLHPSGQEWEEEEVPAKIRLPKNLFIIGTVNIDETTYMFSPKVLDRANVIEFRVSETEMKQFLEDIKPLDLDSINGLGAKMAGSFVSLANNKELQQVNIRDLNTTLIDFFKELKKTGAEFGYRSASEIYRFVAVANQLAPEWKLEEIIDYAIMQKLLPKVHGSRRKLEPVLKTLGALCLAEKKNIEEIFNRKSEVDYNDPTLVKYPISLEKIDRMYKGLIDNGFTSYAEA